MALKRATGKVEVLEVEGSYIYAIKPDKAAWDEYTDSLFQRDEKGEITVRNSEGIKSLYRLCVLKIENVEVEKDGKTVSVPVLTDKKEIVDFLSHITDVGAGRKIDGWLMGLGDLTKDETKNSNGGPDANSSSPSLPSPSTVSAVSPPESKTTPVDEIAS